MKIKGDSPPDIYVDSNVIVERRNRKDRIYLGVEIPDYSCEEGLYLSVAAAKKLVARLSKFIEGPK